MHKTLTLESQTQNAVNAMTAAAGQQGGVAVSQPAAPVHSSSAQTGTPPGAAHPHTPVPPSAPVPAPAAPAIVSLAATPHSMTMGGLPLTAHPMGAALKPMPLLGLSMAAGAGLPAGLMDPNTAAAAAAAARKYQQAATAAAFSSKLKNGGANLVAASSLKSDQRAAKFAPY